MFPSFQVVSLAPGGAFITDNDLSPVIPNGIVEFYGIQFKIIGISPEDAWLHRLRNGNWIWLVKEAKPALIEWEFMPASSNSRLGRIGLQIRHDYGYVNQSWNITAHGAGFDGRQLILPIEGHLEDNPSPLEEPQVRALRRELDVLKQEMARIKKMFVDTIFDPETARKKRFKVK